MNRRLVFSIVLFFSVHFALANKVDELKTDSDVEKFIISLNGKLSKKGTPPFLIKSAEEIANALNCDGNIKTFGIRNWEKVDINGDGHTDLFYIGYWYDYVSYIAMDDGSNRFKIFSLNYSPISNCEVAKVYKINGNTLILFHSNRQEPTPNKKELFMSKEIPVTDTLIYKFDDFIDFNEYPSDYGIDSIKFETSMCFGTCPVFSIGIDKSGNVTYYAEKYNNESGTFRSVINKTKLAEIYDVIDYLSIKKLQDNYSVNWTDYPTCYTTVRFTDGTVKHIKDYGELGTFGLRKLYSLFFALRANQTWQEE